MGILECKESMGLDVEVGIVLETVEVVG